MSSFCIDKCCSSGFSSTHWDQLGTKRLEVAVGWVVGVGRIPEDAKGLAGTQKATRKKIMEQKQKLRSLNKSHNYQLLEAERVSLMSEIAQAAASVAILDPSAHKSCPWSTCFSEAPAAAVPLSHDPSYFHPKENPKTFPATVTTPKFDACT